ncbi:MAG: 50S ribosomal protein L29 [Chitinophagaceae bacterium]|nr:50S ribosomal protein L29 [Chitinophagaceae bacterium]
MATTKKTTKTQEVRAMSAEDIQKQIEDSQLRLKRLTFSHAITPVENPMAIRILRREIAVLKTEQRRKQIGF